MGTMTERITSLAALHAEKERLMQARTLHSERLQEHWTRLSDPDLRRSMVWSSVRSILPQDTVTWQDVVSQGGRMAASSIAFRSRKTRNKLFWMGLSMALPFIVRQIDPERISHLAEELRISLDRVRDRFSKSRNEEAP